MPWSTRTLFSPIMYRSKIILVLLIILASCKNDLKNHVDSEQDKTKVKVDSANQLIDENKVEVLFNQEKFQDSIAISLLQEIKICSNTKVDENGELIAPCTTENFKFFMLNKETPLNDGFILLIKAETNGFPLRRILVFEREKGVLVKTNGFVADIVGIKASKNNYDDLYLRFIDKIQGSNVYYNCLFTWKDTKYEFQSVEVIEEPSGNYRGVVKESMKDSVSKEIFQIIKNHNMIF